MNRNKWAQVKEEEEFEFSKKISGIDRDDPENWTIYKSCLLGFIEEMDKATEVYNMENKK
jgi:hypothetical protein